MYEHKHNRVIPLHAFTHRMAWHLAFAIGSIAVSLFAGMLGFRYFENYSWIDSLLNAAMLLGGMGQINPLLTQGGKLFASFYAIYSGLWVIACTGLILAPIIHRVLHKFHADEK